LRNLLDMLHFAGSTEYSPLISESVTVNTTFSSHSCGASTGSVSRCAASRCRPSRRLRATKEQPGPITPTPLNFLSRCRRFNLPVHPQKPDCPPPHWASFVRVVPTHLFAFAEA